MDKYGCLKPTLEDAQNVKQALALCSSAVFTLSGDDIGAMIIFISTQFEKIGTMPFGGNPVGRAYVGIYGRGCNHLSMGEIHPGYIEEKLGVGREESETFAEFWNLLWSQKS
jgi:hypothetical protein